jgi:mRNA interferase RelE/StbE
MDDIADLDGSEQRQVFKGLLKLRTEREKRCAPLGSGLTAFRKLVVGNRQIRIVYCVEDDGTVAVMWVVASNSVGGAG